ncbi:hypothetical protein COLO4_34003 [Corchorus olitorius]|uniref:Uncharacterized protein n=1 Tax=Corchorus olitorius TaxID=93759 RepID=A0A1R3GPB1_9ROSI|nr:hypothetical protein COLO4_34003 [Corchorus olitorius]
MSNGDDQQLPPRRNLPILAYSIISNLEDLLQLRYLTGSLTSSENIRESPTFAIAIKAILALSPCQTTHDERVLAIVKQWLQISDAELPSPDEASGILERPNILNEIYGRGLANHFPPVYNLLKPTRRRKCEEIRTNYKNVMIEGELSDTICLKTSPSQTAWMSVSSIVQPISASMRHRIQLWRLPERHNLSAHALSIIENLEDQLRISYHTGQLAQNRDLPSIDETRIILHQSSILTKIYSRAESDFSVISTIDEYPDIQRQRNCQAMFFPTLYDFLAIHRPAVAIVTETRLRVRIEEIAAQFDDYRFLHCINPHGYLDESLTTTSQFANSNQSSSNSTTIHLIDRRTFTDGISLRLYDRQSRDTKTTSAQRSCAASSSIQQHLETLIEEQRPHVIILTETRMPQHAGQEWAYRLGYSQLAGSDTIGMVGGMWLFSDPSAILVEQIDQSILQIIVNIRALHLPHY